MAYTTIDDPSAYFHTQLYTGNATARSITNSANAGDFQPDWLWIKVRNNANNHRLFDSSRGANLDLVSNLTQADSDSADRCTDFDSNGFSLGVNAEVNSNTHNIVAWQWKANGGTTTTNDASATGIGNTDSVYQANTTAGFSIVTFSGTGSGMTVAHGLGGTPTLIISKARNDTENWAVHTTVIDGSLDYLRLSETDAAGNSGFSLPTSTVFGYNGSNNYVAYCFRSIPGYSKIGKYVGNGNVNGTFVYTGFKPAWVLVKSVDVAQSWQLSDSARNPSNVVNRRLAPNDASAESTAHSWIDFLSNGFKIRINDAAYNNNGQKYVYMAFAERPFVTSEGVPTTAR
jgi:hypothetical protein